MDERSNDSLAGRIAGNLAALEERISRACERSGRARTDVTLIAVSKTFPAASIDAAVQCGITDVGENRVQELRDKFPGVTARPRWHMIGHLQSNKAKDAVRIFDVIHTIDSEDLAGKVSRHALAMGKTIDVLIEVNVGGEEQKSGIAPADAGALASVVRSIDGLRLRGLMTVPPITTPEETRSYFRQLRELRDRLRTELALEEFDDLSMGMTDDFELAIEEGSTMIRLGRAIFGAR
jgi:pyridoxal phosphate enzyme (YggS family)